MSRRGFALITVLGLVGLGLWFAFRPGPAVEPAPVPRSGAAARGDVAPQVDPEQAEARLSGVVLDRTTDLGLAGALVTQSCGDEVREATTDDAGGFRFTEVGAGACQLTASKAGWLAGGPNSSAPLDVTLDGPETIGSVAGPSVDRLELSLVRAATVTGLVTQAGAPVADAAVSVLYLKVSGEPAAFVDDPGIQTDTEGRFRLAAVLPGRSRVLVEHPDHALAESDHLHLRPGEEIDLAVSLGGGATISGRVEDSDGAAIGGAVVELVRRTAAGAQTTSDDAGRFELKGVPPGTARIRASAQGFSAATEAVEVEAGDEAAVQLVLRRRQLVIRVRSPTGGPVRGASVFVVGPNARAPRVNGRSPVGETDNLGELGLDALPSEGAKVFATHPRWAPSELVSTTGAARLTVVLGEGGGLVGQVADEHHRPLSQFKVSVHGWQPAGGERSRGRAIPPLNIADASGRFAFQGLAPGVYAIRAEASGYAPAIARRLVVEPGKTTDAGTLLLATGATLTGRVVDARTGAPVALAKLRAADLHARVTETARDGRFQLRGLPGERMSLRVHARGYISQLVSGLSPPSGGSADVGDIRLSPLAKGDDGRRTLQYQGVGAVLSQSGDGLRVVRAFPGTPAANAGLGPDAVIVAIDGISAAELDLREAVELIRGEAGSDVELEVRRGNGQPELVTVQRADVTTKSGR